MEEMTKAERMLQRLDEIAQALARADDAVALVGVGSSGRERARFDEYSDLDILVVVEAGAKARYFDDLAWLATVHPISYSFVYDAHGAYKLFFADGVYCELEVYDVQEIREHGSTPGRVIWQRPGIALDWGGRDGPPPAHEPRTVEWMIGEILTNLYVGLGRFRRGEKLSAMRFIQGYAVDRVLELAPHLEAPQAVAPDRHGGERRFELRFPQTAQALPGFLQGYDRTPQSARALLDFVAARFPVEPLLYGWIEELLDGLP
jgi:predicted nucleotidyltransferase